MKKLIGFTALTTISVISLMSFIEPTTSTYTNDSNGFTFPKEIKEILDQSCMGCHTKESSNMKGKMKLKLDQFATLKKSKLVSKLNKIAKEVEKGDMPTKKFVAKYPDKVPTADQKKVLIDWARATAAKLVGE